MSLEHWLRLPAERVRIVRRFIGIALILAAAKVFLNTVGFALFLANEGPSELPRLYLLLAIAAIALSTPLGLVVDRMPKLHVARATLVAIMTIAGLGKVMIAADVAGSYFVILATAYIFEIAIEILFWATCAAYIDATELKRATPLLCIAIAIGGAFGGLLARAMAWGVDAPDLLLVMLAFAALAAVQFSSKADLGELPDPPDVRARPGALIPRPLNFLRAGVRYPLLVLIALNALTLTILYGIAEFLILSVYSERFPGEQELTRFLGIVFAFLQACEFLLLASLSRALLERTSPLLRNLIFPLTSLACLLYLAFSDRLTAAVITHVNAEALSNAIFQPVHNANFLALPVSIQGRARTLSEGIFYPAGLAIAGGLLWSMGETGTTAAAEFVAILFALSFIVLNVGVGVLFLPTLIASVRSGVVPLADLTDRIVGLPAAAADRVRRFLRSARPELRRDGIALSRWLGPAQVVDDLVTLASSADLPTRRALVRLASDDRGSWVRSFVDAAYGRDARSTVVAMEVMLARREVPSAEQAARLVACTDPSALALARLLVEGSDAGDELPPLVPLLRHPDVAADVIEAIVGADRPDHAGILLAALPAAPAEQQRRGLEFLRRVQALGRPSSWRGLGRFARHSEPRVRSEAMTLLGGCRHRAALRMLTRGLADRSALVRRNAADALAAQGDDVVELLRTRLIPITIGSTEAASALSRIDTDRAHHALIASLQQLRREARDNARLLVRLAALPRTEPWLGLAACARDHEARIVVLALAALRASLQRHVFGHVRDALRSEDRRLRADAFEILAALPRVGPVTEAVETLRLVLFETAAGERGTTRAEPADGRATLTLARASPDPWVREAARIAEGRSFAAVSGSQDMMLSEEDLERVLLLKGILLFRHLSLDTLLAVSRSLEAQEYLSGEVIVHKGERLRHCHIIEAGAVSIDRGGSIETLVAPACFNELVVIGEATSGGRIVALEPCRILLLHAVVLQDLSRDHPEILAEVCRDLARRLRAAEGTERPATPLLPIEALTK
jgi:hypothetical protein